MKRAFAAAILSGLMSLCAFSQDGWAGPPRVMDSEPPNHAVDVPVDVGSIIVLFDQEMKTKRPAASPPTAAAAPGQASGRKGGDAFLTLYREQHQGAFYMLIPREWKTTGGMIPSGVQWNVVDLVEHNRL